MTMHRSLGGSTLALAIIAIVAPSCGRDRDGGSDSPQIFPDTSEAGTGETCQGVRCSLDLRTVIDGCTGAVLETCAADRGCGDGRCVPACEAAKLSQGSVGCDFFAIPPDDRSRGGECFAAFIANTWPEPVALTAEYDGRPLDIGKSAFIAPGNGQTGLAPLTGAVQPGQVAIVFLSGMTGRGLPCPGPPALGADPILHGTTRTKSFRLRADRPVSAYTIYPFGASDSWIPSATLLLPVSSWTTNYIAVSPRTGVVPLMEEEPPPEYEALRNGGHPFIQIVAAEADTEVRIRPKVDIVEGYEIGHVTAGTTQAWKLAAGEVLQLTQFNELTGSAIESDKPIGLFGGNNCTFVPSDIIGYCDILDQQIPPLAHWGSEYALVPARSRHGSDELVPYRIVGAVDGTALSYEGAPADAPRSIGAGEVVTFMSRHPILVRSQDAAHPFYAGVYMTGSWYAKTYADEGDPEFVNLVPSEQYLARYVFYMDYSYANSSITVVRRRGKDGFAPVELDCAGALDGFRPLGDSGNYEYAQIVLTSGHVEQPFAAGRCGTGRREARSAEPFALYVWGTDDYASYGYPGGTGLRPITPVRLPVPR